MATVRGRPVAWADFYETARWQRLRRLQLRKHSLCRFSLEIGRVTPATGTVLLLLSF